MVIKNKMKSQAFLRLKKKKKPQQECYIKDSK